MRQREDLVFPMQEYQRRLDALRGVMAEHELDAMLTTTPENISYLTGFDSPGHYWFQGMVVPMHGEPFTFSRLLETSGIDADTWVELNYEYHDSDDIMSSLAARLLDHGLSDARISLQQSLEFERDVKAERLERTLDRLQERFGSDSIRRGSAGSDRGLGEGVNLDFTAWDEDA